MFRRYPIDCVAYDDKKRSERLCEFSARQIEIKAISSNMADGYIADLGNRYVIATDCLSVKELVNAKTIKPRNTLVFVEGEQFRVIEIRFRNYDTPFMEKWQRGRRDEIVFILE